MKKTILSMAAVVLFAAAAGATYVRTTKNGGPDGYNNTKKTENGGNITINCSDPGHEACPSIVAPSEEAAISAAVQEVCVDIATGSISGGQLVGEQVLSIDGSRFLVNWESRDREARTSKITIVKI